MSIASWRVLLPRVLALLAFSLAGGVPAFGQVSVTTQHNDTARTGANLSETTLNTANVNVNAFGKLFVRSVDHQIYAQPLYVPNVAIPGQGTHAVVYVATVNNTVYAFDADDPAAAAPLWQLSFVDPAAGILPVSNGDVGQMCGTYTDFSGSIGIVGTPVIDGTTQTMYVVIRTKESGQFIQRLHALDITTGAQRPGSPMLIQASVPGTGDGHDAQNRVAFNARTQNQRPALLLLNGVVFIAWASHCDQGPYHGWVLGYDAATLQQVAVYNTAPNGGLAGIWQSGQGPAADADGNIYAMTGNGSVDGGTSRGNSFVKLSPTGALLDWFTPYNWSSLNSTDADLGSAGVLVLPDTNLVVGGGKQGVLYVVSRTNLGHMQTGSDSQIVQSFQASTGGRIDGSPVYWNSPNNGPTIYLWAESDPLKAFRFSNGRFQTTPIAQSAAWSAGMPGGMLSLSANASTPGTGILWAALPLNGSANHQVQPGILRAYDASDVTRELWNSQQNPARDALGNFAKYSFPTIANGKVYVPTFSNQLAVYGLLNPGGNVQPVVNAGPDQAIALPGTSTLNGSMTDDGLPNPPAALTCTWIQVSGPGTVTFGDASARATTATFSAPGPYVLRLTANDGALSASDDLTITVNPVNGGGGAGLVGQYYNDPGNGTFFNTLALTRIDATVNFNFGTGSPAAGLQADNFSVRWTGQVLAPVTGSYTFSTTTDDGVRLWVNGQLIIDKWIDQAAITNPGTPITLIGGGRYDVRMEYYEKLVDAMALLQWSYPGRALQVVPQAQLFPVNQQAAVNAGPDQTITLPKAASLQGSGSDDGLPNPPGALSYSWAKVSGREDGDGGLVVFGDPQAPMTTATFMAPGPYVLRLTAFDGALSSSDDITITVNATSPTIGTGLIGQYYNDPGNGAYLSTLALTRTDATVSFNWASGAPAAGLQTDNFSVRWTGQVLAPVTGSYRFYTTTDDGARLWVNGQLVVNRWVDQAPTTNTSAAIALTAGVKYDVKMEYYEKAGGAVAQLQWSYPGRAQQIIPQAQLFPVAPAAPTNLAPTVNAGPDQTLTLPNAASLVGSGSDDGLPSPPGTLTYAWSTVSGAGTVTFGNASSRTTTASFSVAGTYVLRLTANDSALSGSDDVTVVATPAPPSNGAGLVGQYYNDPGNGTYFNTLALTRTDAMVSFNWASGTPATGIQTDNFSVRWTGQVQAPVTGSYRFYTTMDDGVRLWVNGQLIVNRWVDQAATLNTSTAIALASGVKYDVKLEYYEKAGLAVAQLQWSYPGQARQTIPQIRLSN